MQRDLARILDANFNRAREGLRVAEEFARFVVEDRRLAEQAKRFRHELADFARRLDPDGLMVACRDTAGDVGAQERPSAKGQVPNRESADLALGTRPSTVGAVATASAKRVGEALRVLCEYAKADDAAVAAEIDQVRYRFYDWEKSLAGAADRRRIARAHVYLLLTEKYCHNGDWKSAAKAAIDGGADVIQLREKDLPDSQLLDRAGWLVEQCRLAGVLSVINDRPDIARLANADGVHVGRDDLPAPAVRQIVKVCQFIGASTHATAQLEQAIAAGPDYLALGPMFATTTKPDYAVAGLDYARQSISRLDALGIPHVAVGGITVENVGQLIAAGIRCVAVCSAILSAEDIAAATRQFKKLMT